MKYVNLTPEEIHSTFQAIDLNGDGEISQIEFIKALRRDHKIAADLGLPAGFSQESESRALFQQAFHEIDIDDSKTITLQEFANFYKPQQPMNGAIPPAHAAGPGPMSPPPAAPGSMQPPAAPGSVPPPNANSGYSRYMANDADAYRRDGYQPVAPEISPPPNYLPVQTSKSDSPQIKKQTQRSARNAPPPTAAPPSSLPSNPTPVFSPNSNPMMQPMSGLAPGPTSSGQIGLTSQRYGGVQPGFRAQSPIGTSPVVYSTGRGSPVGVRHTVLAAPSLVQQPYVMPQFTQQSARSPVVNVASPPSTLSFVGVDMLQAMEREAYRSPVVEGNVHQASPAPKLLDRIAVSQEEPAIQMKSEKRRVQRSARPPPQPPAPPAPADEPDFQLQTEKRRASRSAGPPPQQRALPAPQQLALPAPEQLALPAPERLALPAPEPEPEPEPMTLRKSKVKASRSAPKPPPSAPEQLLQIEAPRYIPPPPEPQQMPQIEAPPQPEFVPQVRPARTEAPAIGDLVGIGLVLESTRDWSGQELDVVVAAIVPGFAAADSNQFDVGDIVLSIDNVLVSSIPLSEVKQLTIGKVGTQISLIMRSPTEGKDYRVTLTRQVPTMVDKQNQECARAVYRSMYRGVSTSMRG
eukprot:Tamp_07586.p1 GENE.Tamp_07586~~Tamp_07586.p1  ORF type:complete len:634 (+),score=75.41 Tamp_07586:51-1952(+)